MEDENYPIYDLNFTVCAKISFTKTKSREIFIFSIEKNRRFSCIEIFYRVWWWDEWVHSSFFSWKEVLESIWLDIFEYQSKEDVHARYRGLDPPTNRQRYFPVHLAGHFNPRARTINGESLFSLTRRFVRHPGILGLEASDGFKTTRFETWRNKCQRRFERWV